MGCTPSRLLGFGRSRVKRYASTANSEEDPEAPGAARPRGTAAGQQRKNTRVDRPVVSMVSMQATHPDWPEADFFLFSEPENPETPDQGVFYSKRRQFVGVWRLSENVLQLSWNSQSQQDIVRAAVTETQWKNDQTGLCLNVVDPMVLPTWLAPTILSKRYESTMVAEKFNECPICYFELWRLPVGILRIHSKRACPHYFHTDCAKKIMRKNHSKGEMLKDTVCPVCNARFSDVKTLPDIFKDPRAWFQSCDSDFGGSLDKGEVLEALGAVLPVERSKLKKAIDNNWSQWDPDGDGTISQTEFLDPKKGLREFIIRNFQSLKKDGGLALRPDEVPDLDSHPREWFEYWDRDGSGTLERDELVRAMIRTFCVASWGEPIISQAHEMRELGEYVWRSLGYHEFASVTFEEFNKPLGLGDQIYHNFVNGMFFGEDEELLLD